MAESPNQKRITNGQKVGVTFMFVFAMLALGLGFLQLRTTVYGPFVTPDRAQASAADQAQVLFDETLKLQRIDTDKDGLNDFEELNFYQTSPYLPDTDCDGLSDKKEINDGTDPLCPEGQDCGLGVENTFSTDNTDTATIENPLFTDAVQNGASLLGGQTGQGTPSSFDLNTMLGDPTQLRAAVLASGQVSADELAKINDDELLDLAQKALKSQPTAGATEKSNVTTSTLSDVTPAQLQALLDQPEELRKLLITTGKMTKEQLDQIDDTTLITVTKEIIASAS